MEKKELRGIHQLLTVVSDQLDVQLEGTEYEEHGTYYKSIHHSIEDHKEAIYLLSQELQSQSDIPALETWAPDFDDYNIYAGRYGRVDQQTDEEHLGKTANWDNPVGK